MKKILIIILVLSVILVGGCSENQETKGVENRDSLSKTELFDKKKECAEYEQQIKQTISERNINSSATVEAYEELQEIFYSPEKNSCLYIVKRTFLDVCEERHQQQIVYDFFSKYEGGLIGSRICPCSKMEKNEYSECEYDDYYSINKEIYELKGE